MQLVPNGSEFRVYTPFLLLFFDMPLTPEDISRIANLARLELQPAESARMLGQINDFFGIVEKMRSVDTTGLAPLPIAFVKSSSICVYTSAFGALDKVLESETVSLFAVNSGTSPKNLTNSK